MTDHFGKLVLHLTLNVRLPDEVDERPEQGGRGRLLAGNPQVQ